MSKQPTLVDIGRAAGVSGSIVSRVLRGREDRIPDSTRERVLEAAKRLGYRPNLLIRGVQSGRSMNVGVIMPATGSYYSEIVHGIHDGLLDRGYNLMLAWNAGAWIENGSSDRERELIHGLVDRRVDGVILLPTHPGVSDLYFSEVQERKIPIVTVDRQLPGVNCDFAGADEQLGGRLAARHLLEAGHRRLLHLSAVGPFGVASQRTKGIQEACDDVEGASCERIPSQDMVTTLLAILSRDARPTAITLNNDGEAPSVYRIARELDLRIPKDLSVIGYGNTEACVYAAPPLTTIDQKPYRIGRTAAQLVLRRIDGKAEDVAIHLEHPELIQRDSVARV